MKLVRDATDEAGTAGLTLVLATVLVTGAAVVALGAVVDLALTAARARSAADAAALAALGVSPLVAPMATADPHTVAELVAQANGAQVSGTGDEAWPLRYRVRVRVAPTTHLVAALVGGVEASADAAVRPAAPPTAGTAR